MVHLGRVIGGAFVVSSVSSRFAERHRTSADYCGKILSGDETTKEQECSGRDFSFVRSGPHNVRDVSWFGEALH